MVSSIRQSISFLAALCLIYICSGCGASSMNTPPAGATASLRVVQGDADAQTVNVLVNGMLTSSSVAYLSATGYMPVPSGMDLLDIQVPPPLVSPVQHVGVSLAPSTHSTFIMDGCCAFNHSAIQLMDDTTPPASGSAKLRVVDAFLSFPGIDFFVLPAGSTSQRYARDHKSGLQQCRFLFNADCGRL